MSQLARSLRIKLTLWYLAVFLISLGLVVGLVTLARRDVVVANVDAAVARSAAATVENVLVDEPAWDAPSLRALVPADAGFTFVCVRGADGGVLAVDGAVSPSAIPYGDWESVPAGPTREVFTAIDAELGTRITGEPVALRMLTLPFRVPGGEARVLQVAVPQARYTRSLGPYVDVLALGLPVGLVAALLGAWLVAGRAMAPLRRITEAAQAVSPEDLGGGVRLETGDAEVEVSHLQTELNRVLSRLEKAYSAQEQFLSNVSHELKTPIAVLLTQSQTLGGDDEAPPEVREFVASVQEEMAKLGQIVESFLDLTRADFVGELMHRESIPVNELVMEAVARNGERAELAGVRLVTRLIELDDDDADEPEIAGDPELLVSVLDNLIRNAVRFSPQEEAVTVQASHGRDEAVISVRDRGPGIPEDHLEWIFDRFAQEPGEWERARGTGVGLAIARSVVELHGGEVSVNNEPGGGCRFLIRLPLFAQRSPETDGVGGAAGGGRRKSA